MRGKCTHFLILGVIQNPMYLPNIRRVWASRAGNSPRPIVVIGNRIHCKTIQRYFNFPNCGGRGGSRIIDKTAVDISPTMDRVMIVLVMYGRLKDNTVLLNSEPPTITGSHPRRNIIRALVAHE